MKRKRLITSIMALVMALSVTGCSQSQSSTTTEETTEVVDDFNWPESTVTIVVPYGAGGAMDNTARLFAKYAEKICGQPFVISNVAGGSGAVGTMDVLSSDADGSKVLIFDAGPGFVATANNTPSFDILKDFTIAASQTADARNLVVRKDDERFSTPEEFIQYAKDHPGEINVGVAGAYTDAAIALQMINEKGGLDMVMVAFSGAAEAKTALLGGHVDAVSLSVGDSVPMLANDQIMVVANCDDERSEFIPDAPTFQELGIDVVWKTYRGYAFKAGTDQRIVDFFDDLVKQVSEDPEYIKELNALGCPVVYNDSETYTQVVSDIFATIQSILG